MHNLSVEYRRTDPERQGSHATLPPSYTTRSFSTSETNEVGLVLWICKQILRRLWQKDVKFQACLGYI